MQFDRSVIDRLLSLNDLQLKIVVTRLLKENGIDPSALNIDVKDMASLRRTLQNATSEEIERVADAIRGIKTDRHEPRR